jgi:hypothetical protein
MARPSSRRSGQGQQDRPQVPAREGEQSAALLQGADVSRPGPPLHWGWRLALFLWATSFAFLLAYELLAALIKAFLKRP